MKSIALSLLTVLTFALPSLAGEAGHGHSHDEIKAGPNKGRVIKAAEPKLEFFVTAERKVVITPLTDDLQPGKLTGQIIAITAGERSNPTKMELKAEGDKLVSTTALPEGNEIPVSVSIKADASAKAVYEKFNLNLSTCGGCQLPEYACVCGH